MSLLDIHFAGKVFRFEDADGADLVARQMEAGTYEAPLPLLMMATLLRTPGAFVDVGANTGLYAVLAAVVAWDRQVIAFEPHPGIAGKMQENLVLNGVEERVVVHGVALSDQAGRLQLYLPDQAHGLVETSASLEQDFQPSASSIEVEVRRLDDMGIDVPVAVIKVDIEGHEHAFLQGARGLIARERPIVFAEVLGPARRDLLAAFLRSMSYLDFRLRPDMVLYDGEVAFDDAAWNHAFVPEERLAVFREACAASGLPMFRRWDGA